MSESTCVDHERANCRACEAAERRLTISLAKRVFAEGFARGADPDRARKRHVVNPATHAHWMAGHAAGAAAAREALDEYVRNEGLR